MPALTRVNERPETWHLHYAGVRVGTICERSGIAGAAEPWEWHCGFYPGSEPGEQRYGTSASFEAGRAAFEAAWRDYLPMRTEADSKPGATIEIGPRENMPCGNAAKSCPHKSPLR